MKLNEAIKLLSEAGVDSPREDARRLFSHFEGTPLHALIAEDPTTENGELINAIRQRAERVPLQYILGEVEFYRETYRVTPDCLIPRSDTEALVDYAVKNLKRGARILDLCCGSGCIAVSTLSNTRDTRAVAADISEAALSIAEYNAKLNKVGERVEFLQLDVLSGYIPDWGKFDAILSNPPYVSDSVYSTLAPEIFSEPMAAFLGGEDGGDFYRAITPRFLPYLAEDGFIAYEIGYDQSELLLNIADSCDMAAEIIRDLSGNPRVAVLKRK